MKRNDSFGLHRRSTVYLRWWPTPFYRSGPSSRVAYWNQMEERKSNPFSSLIFTGLFTLFLTGFGPFVDQTEIREHEMTWSIKPVPSNGMKQSEVVLNFVEFPQYAVGEYSDELAKHLRENAGDRITAKFRVTCDYGKVRGYSVYEIAGLSGWKSEWGYGSVSGSPDRSPWD